MPFDHTSSGSNPGSVGTFRVLAGTLAFFALGQAVLAGQFLFEEGGSRALHRYVGEGLAALALILAVQGWRIRYRSPISWWLSFVLLILVVAATGLGFAGRTDLDVAALHVPVGVATFGVAVAAATMDRQRAYR